MKELDALYLKLLEWGLIQVRQASRERDVEWCRAEVKLLQDLPNLIGNGDIRPHIEYLQRTKKAYIDWLETANRAAVAGDARMMYAPNWRDVRRIVDQAGTTSAPSQAKTRLVGEGQLSKPDSNLRELDPHYMSLLIWGLVQVRNASEQGDLEWCRAEAEMLHNIPNLIGHDNPHRHLDYVVRIKEDYEHWVEKANRHELASFAKFYYRPSWSLMMMFMIRHRDEYFPEELSNPNSDDETLHDHSDDPSDV